MLSQYEILVENLCVEAIIGVLPSERLAPQRVLINATISYKKQDLDEKYLDYVKIIQHITKCLKDGKYGLLEEALDDIIASLKDSYPSITKIDLTLKKPDIFAKNAYLDSSQDINNKGTKDSTNNADSKDCINYAGCILGVRKVWEI